MYAFVNDIKSFYLLAVSGGGSKGKAAADGKTTKSRTKAKPTPAGTKCRKDKYRDYYIEPDGCRSVSDTFKVCNLGTGT
jgi:hypothetical protein